MSCNFPNGFIFSIAQTTHRIKKKGDEINVNKQTNKTTYTNRMYGFYINWTYKNIT